jgi:DNA (cytosine-5)-methyltransferase 1
MCKKHHGGAGITKEVSFIDLFAGAGGLYLGLSQAGLSGIFAVERDPMAFSTLERNLIYNTGAFEWPTWLLKKPIDIKALLNNYREELTGLSSKIDLVVGGPPCQGFSLTGTSSSPS